MRHLRNLAVAAVAAVALAVAFASPAAATVTVYNEGPIAIDDSTLAVGTQSVQHYSCDWQAGGYVNGDGSFALEDVSIHPVCYYLQPCNGEEWTGQIVGPGDPGYLGVADFEALTTVCLNWGTLSGIPFETRLHINGEGANQEWTWPQQNIVVPGIGTLDRWIKSVPLNVDTGDMEITSD